MLLSFAKHLDSLLRVSDIKDLKYICNTFVQMYIGMGQNVLEFEHSFDCVIV